VRSSFQERTKSNGSAIGNHKACADSSTQLREEIERPLVTGSTVQLLNYAVCYGAAPMKAAMKRTCVNYLIQPLGMDSETHKL